MVVPETALWCALDNQLHGLTRQFLQASLVGDVAAATARQEQFVAQAVCLFNERYFHAPLRVLLPSSRQPLHPQQQRPVQPDSF
jgi:hypothetical protein